MLPSDKCDDDACFPPGHRRALASESFTALAFSSLPFIITFLAVSLVVIHKLFPIVSSLQQSKEDEDHYLPSDAPPSLRQKHAEHSAKSGRRRVVAVTFSATTALAAVLAELILCEISNTLNPAARSPPYSSPWLSLYPSSNCNPSFLALGGHFGGQTEANCRRQHGFYNYAGSRFG
jgi:hypothetical protein